MYVHSDIYASQRYLHHDDQFRRNVLKIVMLKIKTVWKITKTKMSGSRITTITKKEKESHQNIMIFPMKLVRMARNI